MPAIAQTYPNQPISLIIPFTVGGPTDAAARILGEYLAPKLGQPFVPENRAGASGVIGGSIVAKAVPNGYTLFFGSSILATRAIMPGPAMPFDLLKDFEIIGKIARSDAIVTVPSALNISDLRSLVNLMRTQPDKTQFGSAGIGTQGHLAGELMKYSTKTTATHVPYKGESAALLDLLGNRMTFLMCTPMSCAPRIQDGTLKGLAVTAKVRSKIAPDVPTVAEAGVPDLIAGPWWFLAAPKGTPRAVLDKLSTALNQVLSDDTFKKRLLALGLETESSTSSAAVRAELQSDMERWSPIIKAANITAD
ncbi:MAG: tripartite tricarboxylate transporter substrate-binding protein [Hydrogenophaga sp.]|nr:tripartite tricarboxylate transporter substrate-binding protein [Hydrogenophaga sp.]